MVKWTTFYSKTLWYFKDEDKARDYLLKLVELCKKQLIEDKEYDRNSDYSFKHYEGLEWVCKGDDIFKLCDPEDTDECGAFEQEILMKPLEYFDDKYEEFIQAHIDNNWAIY